MIPSNLITQNQWQMKLVFHGIWANLPHFANMVNVHVSSRLFSISDKAISLESTIKENFIRSMTSFLRKFIQKAHAWKIHRPAPKEERQALVLLFNSLGFWKGLVNTSALEQLQKKSNPTGLCSSRNPGQTCACAREGAAKPTEKKDHPNSAPFSLLLGQSFALAKKTASYAGNNPTSKKVKKEVNHFTKTLLQKINQGYTIFPCSTIQ